MAQATYSHIGNTIDYTPASDVEAGQVVVVGNLVGVASRPIASGELGAIAVRGVFDVVKANVAISAGDAVYWDADGDPVGGEAGSGAATNVSTDNTFMGYAVADAAAADGTVRVTLAAPAPNPA